MKRAIFAGGAVAAMTLAKVTVERGRADNASREKTAAQRLMVQALLSLTEVRDAETGRHSRRTQQYARLLAEQLATQPEFRAYLTRERIDLLSSLAPLHDIGKVGVPDAILLRPTVVVVFDSVRDEMSVVTPVRPAPGVSASAAWERACERIEAIVARLEGPLVHDEAADPHLLAVRSRDRGRQVAGLEDPPFPLQLAVGLQVAHVASGSSQSILLVVDVVEDLGIGEVAVEGEVAGTFA